MMFRNRNNNPLAETNSCFFLMSLSAGSASFLVLNWE